jgi:folate-binding protein YgfZ
MDYINLTNRLVLTVSGPDKLTLLQGLISNDTNKVSSDHLTYALMLTPQGKYFCDLFIWAEDDSLFVDCPAELSDQLMKKLNMYKLRSKVTIDKSDLIVNAVVDSGLNNTNQPRTFIDPRLNNMGHRVYSTSEIANQDINKYNEHRIPLGVPEHGDDLINDKSIPLECHADKLNAIDWDKGCYMGQELTARTNYRGLIRKCLFPILFTNNLSSGAIITNEHNKKVGTVFSISGQSAIAMIRIEAIENKLQSDGANITVIIPEWLQEWLSAKQVELKE